MRSVDETLSSPRGRKLASLLGCLRKPWDEIDARALLGARGYCEYCGADVLSSPEAFGGSQWDHIVPRALGGEDEKEEPWVGKLKEVFEKNIAVVCRKCNHLKRGELPRDVDAKDLLALPREQRVDRIRPWVQELRRHARVVEEFAAFRELVELVR